MIDIISDGGIVQASAVLTVQYADAERGFELFARYEDRTELIYAGQAPIQPPVSTEPGYTVTPTGPGEVEVSADGGWPESFTLVARAIGFQLTEEDTATFIVLSEAMPGDPADTIEPEVSNITPAPGEPITATTPVGLDVTDDTGFLRRAMIAVHFAASGIVELAHDGDSFVGPYTSSTRDPIDLGFRFTVRRTGGWPSSPTVRVFAFDRSGNEV